MKYSVTNLIKSSSSDRRPPLRSIAASMRSQPPVCRLTGYGKYQFNNLPIVVSSFFYTLNEDVDYITIDPKASQSDWTAVPTRAEFTIECLPAFSRRDQAMFNIDDFVKGDLTKDKGMI